MGFRWWSPPNDSDILLMFALAILLMFAAYIIFSLTHKWIARWSPKQRAALKTTLVILGVITQIIWFIMFRIDMSLANSYQIPRFTTDFSPGPGRRGFWGVGYMFIFWFSRSGGQSVEIFRNPYIFINIVILAFWLYLLVKFIIKRLKKG